MRIEYMTRDDLWARLVEDRAALEALWQPLDEAAMLAVPGPQADWSVKDLIAHITWWESYALLQLPAALERQGGPLTREQTDLINAGVYEQFAHMPLPDVLEAFAESFTQLEAAITPLTDEEINNGYVLFLLIGNTFGHYGDHYADLAAYVGA